MKSLYESILSSTSSGVTARIREWWESNHKFTDKGKYRIENINGKFFIIIDEFEKQPNQGSVEFQARDVQSMPKQLSGIYYMYYKTKGEEGLLRPVNLHFTHCSNTTIDLSNWDMSLGPIGRLDIHILIMFSSPGVELIGLPKYASEFNVQLSNCTDIKSIRDINAPNGEIEFGYDDEYTSIIYKDIKNCTLRELFVNKANIERSSVFNKKYNPNIEFYKRVGRKWVIDPSYADCIQELLQNNTIGNLRYQYSSSHDEKALKRYNGLEIQPYKDQWGNDTFAIVPIK